MPQLLHCNCCCMHVLTASQSGGSICFAQTSLEQWELVREGSCGQKQGCTSSSEAATVKSSPAMGTAFSPDICTAVEGVASVLSPALSFMLRTCSKTGSCMLPASSCSEYKGAISKSHIQLMFGKHRKQHMCVMPNIQDQHKFLCCTLYSACNSLPASKQNKSPMPTDCVHTCDKTGQPDIKCISTHHF